jgi:hypothetical protein
MDSAAALTNRRPSIQLLTDLEEMVIVQYILDLDSRGFPPRVADVEDMANHILTTRRAAYERTITKKNIEGGFRGSGLIPFNPEAVISKLDVKLRTPTPTEPPTADADPWVSQTPHNPTEAIAQSTLVKDRILGHQGSSPTPIFNAVAYMAKGMEAMAHSVTLSTTDCHNLRKANEALSKRRRAKKNTCTRRDTYYS